MYSGKVEICGVNTSKLPVLKGEEKRTLFRRILEGDEEAREQYIFGNLRLVLSIIQRFNNRGEYVDDIFQVGCIGLIKAIDNFDVTQGVQFSTYAVPIDVIWGEWQQEDTRMTRKQALHKALEALTDNDAKGKLRELLDELPLVNWTEKSIFDTIDQFIQDHDRPPTVTDFKKKGLPPHTVIKLRFGINLREFLDMYYPTEKLNNSKIYFIKPREHWQELFVTEYHKIKPASAEEYNSNRPEGSPSWQTIAKMFEIIKWLDWLKFCEISPYINKKQPIRGSVIAPPIHITSAMTITRPDGRSFQVAKNNDGELRFA